jgi:hypothetical protein
MKGRKEMEREWQGRRGENRKKKGKEKGKTMKGNKKR